MALPTGPAGRPKKKPEPLKLDPPQSDVTRVEPQDPPQPQPEPTPMPRSEPKALRRITDRVPSEILARDGHLSPAVLGLSLEDFFDLLYQDAVQLADLTVEEFFRMRDNHAFPDPFTAGDARTLFTEDMCRRGLFVPVGWHQEGMYFATCKPESAQDDLAKALDLLVKLPVTLYTVSQEQLDAGITWLFRK